MWQRSELKERAKAVLRFSYWKALLVSLLILFAGGGRNPDFDYRDNDLHHFRDIISPDILLIIIAIVLAIVWLYLLFRVFVGYSLEVGGRRFFVQAAEGNADLSELSFGFQKGQYFSIVKTMLRKGVFNFLWYFVFLIPGIVKGYAYRMVPYILADNPNIGASRAIALSQQMTMGEKMNIWVLDLSFIGWYLLGVLAFGVGAVFVMPYDNATNGELYLVLRQKALDQGLCTYEELHLTEPVVVDGEGVF